MTCVRQSMASTLLRRRLALRAKNPSRYKKEQKRIKEFLRNLKADLKALGPYLDEVVEEAESMGGSLVRNFNDLAESDLNIQDWLSMYGFGPTLEPKVLARLRDFALGKKNQKQTYESLRRLLEPAYIEKKREEAQRPLHEVGITPEVIERILPPSFTVEIGPGKEVLRELSVFGNKLNTIERKSEAMEILIDRWNDMVAKLNEDLESPDPLTKLSALVSSIIVHTGIRPGSGGMGKLKTPQGEIVRDDEGKPIKVDTVGATGLKPEHIKFLRKDFAELKFPGKSGTINIATLKDPALVKALRHQIEHTKGNEADEGFVFVTEDGRQLTPNLINKYLKQIVDPRITASDFRKLKATQVFYDSLRSRKEELLDSLAELKFDAMADMKEAIVETVLDHLEESAADAQQALSHEDVRTTIESYINPRVVLHYLTNAGVDDALEKVVGGGRELKVSFDPIDFYNKVRKKNMPKLKAARRFATTMFGYGEEFAPFSIDELMEDLQEDLQL